MSDSVALSPFLQWPLPQEDQDPWIDGFLALIAAIDASAYGPSVEDRNIVLMSSATITFAAESDALSWNADLDLLCAPRGVLWKVTARSVTIRDGEMLAIQITRSPTSSVVAAPYVARTVPAEGRAPGDALVLAIRRGTRLYWRNGKITQSGASEPITPVSGVTVQSGGTEVGVRNTLNFSGMVTVADNPGSGRLDITVPQRGATGQAWHTRIPIAFGRDTDQSAFVDVGHVVFDPSDYTLGGTNVVAHLEATGFVTVSGVDGEVRLEDVNDATFVRTLLFGGLDTPTRLSLSIAFPTSVRLYRIRIRALGSTSPAQRFCLEGVSLRITATVS